MNKVQEVFGKPRVLLPVVHCIDEHQARCAVDVAIEHGADGVFLINQGGMGWVRVLRAAEHAISSGAPWVGVNLVRHTDQEALVELQGSAIAGLWSDNAGIVLDHPEITERRARGHKDLRARWNGLFFGGVAFKYQAEVPRERWGEAASIAAGWVDVITTSGPATGEAAPIAKVEAMRAVIGDHALAIASGITPDNVAGFLPFVNAYLVATGIEERFGVFDPGRVKALADAIHQV